MIKRKYLFCIGISIIFLLSFYPNITSRIIIDNKMKVEDEKSNYINSKGMVFNTLRYDEGKIIESKFTKISKLEKNTFDGEINSIYKSKSCYKDKFSLTLDSLKKYKLVSNNTKLNDIIDFDGYNISNIKFKNITNKNFKSHLSPILIIGGGFGIGFGVQEKGIFNSFSHFFTLIGGLAYVLCIDFFEETVYNLISFMFPVLFGYMAGYTGIIIFCVMPGMFYSNLVMLGFAPFTTWLVFPEETETTS